jgi:pimeloyl-ACP methyl ester carboxylesterase
LPEAKQSPEEHFKALNLKFEIHKVETEDGYMLTLWRVRTHDTEISSLKPVLLQHGLMDSSGTWLVSEYQLPVQLAHAGYDVWMGNNRGNRNSMEHVSLDPEDVQSKYWDFSFSEMAKYDLPSMLKYIKLLTESKINYIGHSQGTLQFFTAATFND